MTLYNLGRSLDGQGRFGEAESVFEESLSIYSKVRREPHSETAWTLTNLGWAQLNLRKYDAAERTYRAAIEMFEKAPNAVPAEIAFAWDGLGEALYARTAGAGPEAFRRGYQIRQVANETGHGLADSQSLLAKIECEGANPEAGERLAQQSVELAKGVKKPHPIGVAFAESVLGARCRAARGRFDEAEHVAHQGARDARSAGRRIYARESIRCGFACCSCTSRGKKPANAAVWRPLSR